jgi:phospholipid/cholesterol/gamma-HCH transport system permease protein
MNAIAQVGNFALDGWREIRYLSGITWRAMSLGVKPRYWTRAVRVEFYRQVISIGVGSAGFVFYVAFAVGILVVAQALVWLQIIGQSKSLGALFVTVLIREAVPILTNFLFIGRSGTAVTTELGNMKISGEVRVLDAQGIDPFIYLVIPRVLSLTVSVFCLAVLFVVVSFTSGYLFSLLLSPDIRDPGTFIYSILFSVNPVDLINFLAKSIIPALFTGAICCAEGLRVESSFVEVSQATKRALSRSVRALFGISALVTLLTYV